MCSLYDMDRLVTEFDVEFWNLSAITAKESLSSITTKGLVEVEVNSHCQFKELLKEKRKQKPLYFTVMGLDHFSIMIYIYMALFRCKLCYVTNGTLPSVPVFDSGKHIGIFDKLSNMVYSGSYVMAIKRMAIYALKHTIFVKHADIVMKSSNLARVFTVTSKNVRIVNSNSGDYQNALTILKNETKSIVEGKYIVFLDQYTPFHNDYVLLGLKRPSEQEYFDLLLPFFDSIEKKTGLKVIISAHPSALGYKDHDYFSGRPVFYNSTAILVKHAEAVITHNTTSVSFPVVYNKPIIYTVMDNMCDYDINMAKKLSQATNSPLYTIPKDDFVGIPSVSQEAYSKYVRDYLSLLDGEQVSNFDVISSIINSL